MNSLLLLNESSKLIMHILLFQVFLCLIACTLAAPQGYRPPQQQQNRGGYGGGRGGGGGQRGGGGGGGYGGGQPQQQCREGVILHVDGRCVRPKVSRNIFSYAAPEQTYEQGPAPNIPDPKVEYNIIFVRTPEDPEGVEPIVVPPPVQKTLVYVLNKAGDIEGQKVIEVDSPVHQPEVYYVNYNEGDNPTLPGGIDLNSALQANTQQGQVLQTQGPSGGGGGLGGGYGAPQQQPRPQQPTGGYNAPPSSGGSRY